MVTFKGLDKQTNSTLGFYTILAKIESSHHNNSSHYLLKNLIILDTLIENKLFLKDISSSSFDVNNHL